MTANLSGPGTGYLQGQVVYDAAEGYDLEFGGQSLLHLSQATWIFQNRSWRELNLTVSPPAEYAGSMVWDPVDGGVLLFGGSTDLSVLNETWIFRQGGWTELHPTVSPPGRSEASLAWDSADGYAVLFGGVNQSFAPQNDTWIFSHGNWTELNESQAPTSRYSSDFTEDPNDQGALLFGGYSTPVPSDVAGPSNDTWLFRSGNWTELHPSRSPGPRAGAGVAFDLALGSVVLFGGVNTTQTLGDTWAFSQGDWTPLTGPVAPAARLDPGLAADPADGGLLLVGGWTTVAAGPAPELGWVLSTLQVNASAEPLEWEGARPASFNASVPFGAPPYGYAWNFGDGTTSTLERPQHVFSEPGTYYAEVTVDDLQFSVTSRPLTVTELPTLSVAASAAALSGSAPLRVAVSAVALGGAAPYRYVWRGSTVAPLDVPNGTLEFAAPGVYPLLLSVSDALGYSTNQSLEVTVESAPSFGVEIAPSGSLGPAPLSVPFSSTVSGGSGPYAYFWTFGTGQVASTPDPRATFPIAGNYSIVLTVTDSNGVKETATTTVRVAAGLALAAHWSVPTAAAPLTTHFTVVASGGTPPYVYLWNFGDGGTGTQIDPVHSYLVAGTYRASVEVVDAVGHQATQSLDVSLTPGPLSVPPASATGVSHPTVLEGVAVALIASALGATIVLLAAAGTAWSDWRRRR